MGASIADIASGMYALTNIMAALMKRSRTGQGVRIDISMLESMVEWMSHPLYYAYAQQPGPRPTGAAHATICPYGPFATGDGGSVMLGVQNEREWARMCDEVLDDAVLATDARFATNPRRVANRGALDAIVRAAFARLSAEAVVARLDAAGIANAQVRDMHGVWAHPQLRARGRWTEVGTPRGPVPALLPPGVATAAQCRMDDVPALGQHTGAILRSSASRTSEVRQASR